MGEAKRRRAAGMPPKKPKGAALNLWCTRHWQEYGPLKRPETGGIALTLTLLQRFSDRIVGDYRPRRGGLVPTIESVAQSEGPACCYLGDGELQLLVRAQELLATLQPGRLDSGERLSHYLERVRRHDAGEPDPGPFVEPEGPHFWYEMTYSCRRCGHEEPILLEAGLEGPRAQKVDSPAEMLAAYAAAGEPVPAKPIDATSDGRIVLPVPMVAGPCPRCQAGPPPWKLEDGALVHTDWSRDRHVVVHGDPGRPHFRYPDEPFAYHACGRLVGLRGDAEPAEVTP